MKRLMKIAAIAVAALSLTVVAGVMFSQKEADAKLPEYVGSQACLGCHSGKYERWEASGHHEMVTEVTKNADLPGDPLKASTDLQAELAKAQFVVAGQRFLARDQATGELKYLNVQWNAATSQYQAMKGGSSWTTGCAGCHSTGWNVQAQTWAEPGIGCEMCHGPGRDHILGKGDVSKIVANTDAVTCGQCHNGTGKTAAGIGWPQGFRPGMKDLAEVGYDYAKVADPHGPVPEYGKPKMRQFAMWQASAHANAMVDLQANSHSSSACVECHSAQGASDAEDGIAQAPAAYNDGVSCVSCHSPHSAQLKEEPKALCESCHNAEIQEGATFKAGSAVHHPNKEMLEGYGAIGIAPTKGAHSEQSCAECHMTEGNHMMKIIKPEDVMGTARKDTCTSCHAHEGSSPESRNVYLGLWKESVTGKLEAIKADQAVIDAAVKANANLLTADQKAMYDAAKTNASFVEQDKSNGAHNFEYAIKVLTKAQKDMAAVKAAIGK